MKSELSGIKIAGGGKSVSGSPTYPVGTIAKLLMLSERRVQQLTAEGVIPKAERGRYELAPAVQGYIKFLQERTLGPGHSGPIDFHAEKARLTKFQADTAEIELAKARAEVVSVRAVEKNLSNVFAQIRANLRNIPDRVVSALIGTTDERKFKTVLMEEIDMALDALADADVMIEEPDDADELSDGEFS